MPHIHLNYDQKKEIGSLIHKGEDEEAMQLVKKYAICNTREAKEYINNQKRHIFS